MSYKFIYENYFFHDSQNNVMATLTNSGKLFSMADATRAEAETYAIAEGLTELTFHDFVIHMRNGTDYGAKDKQEENENKIT